MSCLGSTGSTLHVVLHILSHFESSWVHVTMCDSCSRACWLGRQFSRWSRWWRAQGVDSRCILTPSRHISLLVDGTHQDKSWLHKWFGYSWQSMTKILRLQRPWVHLDPHRGLESFELSQPEPITSSNSASRRGQRPGRQCQVPGSRRLGSSLLRPPELGEFFAWTQQNIGLMEDCPESDLPFHVV